VTVDCVVFGVDLDDSEAPLKVLLIRRARGLFKDAWALPGGYVRVGDDPQERGEDVEAAAYRELEEETSIKVAYLEQLCTFGKANRDPRGRTISVAYFALVRKADYEAQGGGDAAEARWSSFAEATNLAFDHDEILSVAISRLQAKIQYTPVGFNLLPERFSLSQLQDLYEAILMRKVDRRNFRKRILALGILSAAGVEDSAGKPGPKATLYRFNKRAYRAIKSFTFEV
jgi:8-oxo-dGTP diphosphatase